MLLFVSVTLYQNKLSFTLNIKSDPNVYAEQSCIVNPRKH